MEYNGDIRKINFHQVCNYKAFENTHNIYDKVKQKTYKYISYQMFSEQ